MNAAATTLEPMALRGGTGSADISELEALLDQTLRHEIGKSTCRNGAARSTTRPSSRPAILPGALQQQPSRWQGPWCAITEAAGA